MHRQTRRAVAIARIMNPVLVEGRAVVVRANPSVPESAYVVF
jgi:hypothetical protein